MTLKKYFISLIVLILIILFSYLSIFFNRNYRSEKVTVQPQTKPAQLIKKEKKLAPGFRLIIPKLNIKVPIIPNVDGNDKQTYFQALQNGVAHYANSSLPGENGHIFIFGHSNFYFNDQGKYKTIFNQLNKLKTNDQVKIHYKRKLYKYSVIGSQLINPSQVNYLKQTKQEQLSLMTCWPPGTTVKRLLVKCQKFTK